MPEETQPTGGDAGANAGAEAVVEQMVPQSKVDEIKARVIAKAGAEAEKLRAEIAQMKEAQRTDAEKALGHALKARDDEWGAKLKERDINAEIRVRLIEKGLDPDLIHLVRARGDVSEIEEVGAAIEGLIAAKPHLKPAAGATVPRQGGAPSATVGGAEDEWTLEKIRQVRIDGTYAKHRESIARAMARPGGVPS
jgi:hypothetical protein